MKLDLEANVSETTRLLKDGTDAVGGAVADPTKILSDLPDPLRIMSKEKTIMSYEAEDLTAWSALMIYSGSIFTQRQVIRILYMQLGTCWAVAYLLAAFTRHPENYRTDAVQEIIKTITISIAFLLGLFLNQCVSRWWDTVTAIEQCCGSMKKVMMLAINLGLPKAAREAMARYMALSIRILEAEINYVKHESRQKTASSWFGVKNEVDLTTFWDLRMADFEREGWLSKQERAELAKVPPMQRSQYCWHKVSDEICSNRSKITAGGSVDSVAFDRLCELAQKGVGCLSDIQALQSFQLPYIYVHMLAFMVHFVNILTAAGTGCSVGLMLAQAHTTKRPLDMSQVGSYMVFVLVQAFLYQAFLSIGAALSFPISGSAYKIPLLDKAQQLEQQLGLMNKLASKS